MKFYCGLSAAIIGTAVVLVQPQIAVPQALEEQDLGTLAKEVTVVINGQNPGSGRSYLRSSAFICLHLRLNLTNDSYYNADVTGHNMN